jgi:uncharacterized membrane protein YeaQ/YmgE (transglycosylase-associated protein family)
MLALISWIVFGLMVGALARLVLTGSSDCLGWFATLAICVAGSVMGGYVGSLLWSSSVGFDPGLFFSLVAAILLLLIAVKIGRGAAIG